MYQSSVVKNKPITYKVIMPKKYLSGLSNMIVMTPFSSFVTVSPSHSASLSPSSASTPLSAAKEVTEDTNSSEASEELSREASYHESQART